MTPIIDDAMIDYVGILAKLMLSPEEKEAANKDMGRMLSYIEMLNELDTSKEEPMTHIFPVCNVFREDEDGDTDTDSAAGAARCRELLKNAPAQKDHQYQVPRTVE